MKRIRSVKEFRTSHAGKLGKSLANQPTKYHVTVVPNTDFLVIPEVSSERREYTPIGYLRTASSYSQQSAIDRSRCYITSFCLVNIDHAHGLDAPCWRAVEKRL